MKQLLFIIPLVFLFACGKAQEKHIDYSKSSIIEFPSNSDFDTNDISFVKIYAKSLQYFDIEFFNCKGWESDPGDFRKIEIAFDNNVKEIINLDGWVKINDDKFFNYYKMPWYQIIVLQGYRYESDPAFLTIILVSDDRAEIIFNDKFLSRTIKQEDDRIVFEGEYNLKDTKLILTETELRIE